MQRSLRSVVDEIALSVVEVEPDGDLETLITSKTMDYIAKLSTVQPALNDDELDRVGAVIVAGVLKRLAQISEGGGQIGTA